MSNPFKLRKEPITSPFNEATLVKVKHESGKAKRFLFDTWAEKALKLDENKIFSFIIHSDYILLADVTNVDFDKWGIIKEEINSVKKSKVDFEINGEYFKFRTFNNSKLYNVLNDEFEYSNERDYYFKIILINDWDGVVDSKTETVLNDMGVVDLYFLQVTNNINNKGWKQIPNPKYKSRPIDPGAVYSYTDPFEDYMNKYANIDVQIADNKVKLKANKEL